MSACRLGKFGARKLLYKPYWGLTFTAEEAGCVINMTSDNDGTTPIPELSLEYSLDCSTWTDFDTSSSHATPVTLANIGDMVFFRAKNPNTTFCTDDSAWNWFTTSKTCKVGGNVMSLLDGQNRNLKTLSAPYALAYLFYDCKITDASLLELPASSLTEYCYFSMFFGCSSLTSAPELPAMNLANCCYYQMFYGCTSLTSAPELPAMNLAASCYYSMFYGCVSLSQEINLIAPVLVDNCYSQMFLGCRALSKLRVEFSSWRNGSTTNWLNGVASTGEFLCPSALGTDVTITRGTGNCPTGWTVVNI